MTLRLPDSGAETDAQGRRHTPSAQRNAPAILTALRTRLGPLKSPRSLVWREEWPTLPSGKTDLKALEASLWPA